jgi:Transglutaminase-like superfamily
MHTEASTIIDVNIPNVRWLSRTKLLNLKDDRLRLRAMSMVQLANSERERLMAIYEFVKAMPLSGPSTQGFMSAREVLDSKTGDAFGKSTLFVAMLRLVNIPARMRFVQLHGDVLRGFTSRAATVIHPVVECWVDGRWLKTDTHIYDIRYLVTAREKLMDADWMVGYGIHRHAHSVWDGRQDAYAGFAPTKPQGMPMCELGVFDDPRRFSRRAKLVRNPFKWLDNKICDLKWSIYARMLRSGMHKMRGEIAETLANSGLSEPARIGSK